MYFTFFTGTTAGEPEVGAFLIVQIVIVVVTGTAKKAGVQYVVLVQEISGRPLVRD